MAQQSNAKHSKASQGKATKRNATLGLTMIKRTPADTSFSKAIRIRNNYICEYCGADMSHDLANLHCSHFVSRGYLATRYNPSNAFAHCHKCHDKLGGGRFGGGNFAEFAQHYDDVFGAQEREFIRRLSRTEFRKHKSYIKEISAHYRKEFRRMEALRESGETGRIEFEGYNNMELLATQNQIRAELK